MLYAYPTAPKQPCAWVSQALFVFPIGVQSIVTADAGTAMTSHDRPHARANHDRIAPPVGARAFYTRSDGGCGPSNVELATLDHHPAARRLRQLTRADPFGALLERRAGVLAADHRHE